VPVLTPLALVLIGADAIVVTLLLRAGSAKLVSPQQAAAAIGELRAAGQPAPIGFVRLLAAFELTIALALAFPGLRTPAHLLVFLFGVVFAGAGVVGVLRGSNRPCGCFGTQTKKPLGAGNVLLGLAFSLSAAAQLSLPAHAAASVYTALVAVVLSTSWLFVTHRRRARTVLGHIVNRSEVAA
jgi:hypothetical protein